MKALTVVLPAIKKALRSKSENASVNDQNVEKKKKYKLSTERAKKYREKLKNDPEYEHKLKHVKEQKKAKNKAYKSKVKQLRTTNEDYDKAYKEKQREWKRDSRKRKQKTTNKIVTEKKETQKITQQKSKSVSSDKTATTRKRAERVRKIMPQESESWAKTMKHMIKNATPRRKSMLKISSSAQQKQSNIPDPIENVSESFGINETGRPTKMKAAAKRKLAFSSVSTGLWKNRKSLDRYRKRKADQPKRLSKAHTFKKSWMPKLHSFLESNSRVMPNKKDTVILEGSPVAKRHLLCSKKELYKKFKEMHPDFSRKFTTFKSMVPKNFKRLDLTCRRVCVCTKDYNFDQKVEALNKLAQQQSMLMLKVTTKQLSDKTLCPYKNVPNRPCIDRQCTKCGISAISNHYHPLVNVCGDQMVKHIQWENTKETYISKNGTKKQTTRWVQKEKTSTVVDLVSDVANSLKNHSSHLFRANFQYKMESMLSNDLPMDQCLVVMDFSENITLQSQDEIESAHWTQKQVTLHPIFIVRHSHESTTEKPVIIKESLVILSDHLTHNAEVVYSFTTQLLAHLSQNPGPCPIKTIHRFSDNCSCQYKCKTAFQHMPLLYEIYGIQVTYHYTESGHGKGPSDGIGAGIKRRLDNLVLGGKVVNNAYHAYLTLVQNPSDNVHQKVIFMPRHKILKSLPKMKQPPKSLQGTQSFHMITQHQPGSDVLSCYDLSCTCKVCTGNEQGPCFYGQFRQPTQHFSLTTGKKVSPELSSPGPEHIIVAADQCPLVASNTNNLESVLHESITSNNDRVAHSTIELRRFESAIAKKGWQVRGQTPEDGNCFFWAVSDQLDTKGLGQKTHVQLRESVIQHMQSLSEVERTSLEPFLTADNDFNQYIDRMSKSGTYVDHVCAQNACKALECNISVVHAEGPNIQIVTEDAHLPTLVLGYIPELEHYVILERLHRIKPDDYVAVALQTKRNTYIYIAKVLSQMDSDVKVRFLKSTGATDNYTWPKNEDTSWQSYGDIVKRLDMPIVLPGRGLTFKFNLSDLKLQKKFVFK